MCAAKKSGRRPAVRRDRSFGQRHRTAFKATCIFRAHVPCPALAHCGAGTWDGPPPPAPPGCPSTVAHSPNRVCMTCPATGIAPPAPSPVRAAPGAEKSESAGEKRCRETLSGKNVQFHLTLLDQFQITLQERFQSVCHRCFSQPASSLHTGLVDPISKALQTSERFARHPRPCIEPETAPRAWKRASCLRPTHFPGQPPGGPRSPPAHLGH